MSAANKPAGVRNRERCSRTSGSNHTPRSPVNILFEWDCVTVAVVFNTNYFTHPGPTCPLGREHSKYCLFHDYDHCQDGGMEDFEFLARMDPEVAETFASQPILDLEDIPSARSTLIELLTAAGSGSLPSSTVVRKDHVIPGLDGEPEVKVRHYRPLQQSGNLPCLLWIHSGGHVLGQLEQDDLNMDDIVDAVGCVVISVDWRRAPEHPFPAEINDCYAGLQWANRNAARLRIDPTRIAIGGASSGGGSAAGLALMARDRGEVPVCFQLLIYPMLDDRNSTLSSYSINDPRVWNRKSNLIGWHSYLGSTAATSTVSSYAAPTRAVSLKGLPPAYISVGDLDLFLDEDIEYAQRLLQAGVATELHVYSGAVHGFDLFAPGAKLSQQFIGDRNYALRQAFQL